MFVHFASYNTKHNSAKNSKIMSLMVLEIFLFGFGKVLKFS